MAAVTHQSLLWANEVGDRAKQPLPIRLMFFE